MGGWFWRFGFGGSAHWVPGVHSDPAEGLVADGPSPCGQAQRDMRLTRDLVIDAWTCSVCRRYAVRHGIALPPDGAIITRTRLEALLMGLVADTDRLARAILDGAAAAGLRIGPRGQS